MVLRTATFVSSRARAYDPVALLEEFADLLRAETNFVNEASSLDVIGRMFADSDAVTIPRAITSLSSEGVLVMDWIEGVPLSDRQRLARSDAKQLVLARTILRAYGVMIFQADRFHADPHPGNLIAIDGERLGIVDFGEVGSVEPADRLALLQVMAAVMSHDGDALAIALLSISRATRPIEPTEFGPQLSRLLEPVADAHMGDVNLGENLRMLLQLLRYNGLVLPSTLAVLIKTIIECETTIDELDPNLSMRSVVSEFGVVGGPKSTGPAETE
jgi:ubiquinone biosynthesis protein